jgi:hypothetical protein
MLRDLRGDIFFNLVAAVLRYVLCGESLFSDLVAAVPRCE